MLAQESVPLIDQGAVQFILLGVMILIVFIALWLTIAKEARRGAPFTPAPGPRPPCLVA